MGVLVDFHFDSNTIIGLIVLVFQVWNAFTKSQLKVWVLENFVTRKEYEMTGPLRAVAAKLDSTNRIG